MQFPSYTCDYPISALPFTAVAVWKVRWVDLGVLSCGFSLFVCLISSDKGLLCSPCWTITYNVVKIDLKLTAILLPQLSSTEITGLQLYIQLAFLKWGWFNIFPAYLFFLLALVLSLILQAAHWTEWRRRWAHFYLSWFKKKSIQSFSMQCNSGCSFVMWRLLYWSIFFIFIISLGISSWINDRLWFLPWLYFIMYFWSIFS